ncbi:hypothetical protein ACFL17_02625 [Pseudomonadota bacterium]
MIFSVEFRYLRRRNKMDRVIILLVFALFIFATPFTGWWLSGGPWYIPYLLWFGVIVLGFWLQKRRRRHDL